MKNVVSVWFDPANVMVDNLESFQLSTVKISLIEEKLPNDLDPSQVLGIDWNMSFAGRICFGLSNGTPRIFESDRYNDFIQPYVNLWQAEKDRIEQEQEEQEAEYNKFENRQARALTQLNADFETVKERSHIKSSLGFTVDANQTANENVNGLLVTIGDGTCEFCDYYNQFHTLNKAQLQTLQTEIIANAQNLYQQKWVYRTQIEGCSDNEQLDEVVSGIEFTYMDFTQSK